MDIIIYAALCDEDGERETAYGLLAKALEEELGVSPLPKIEREALGKPFFPDCPGIHFSVSHSHGAAVCAIHDRPIGVDVEKLRRPPRRVAGGLGAEEFFRLWTAKEATVKRQGRGVGAILRGAEPEPLCRVVEGVLPGYIVSVCPSGADATVRVVAPGLRTPDGR